MRKKVSMGFADPGRYGCVRAYVQYNKSHQYFLHGRQKFNKSKCPYETARMRVRSLIWLFLLTKRTQVIGHIFLWSDSSCTTMCTCTDNAHDVNKCLSRGVSVIEMFVLSPSRKSVGKYTEPKPGLRRPIYCNRINHITFLNFVLNRTASVGTQGMQKP